MVYVFFFIFLFIVFLQVAKGSKDIYGVPAVGGATQVAVNYFHWDYYRGSSYISLINKTS